MKDAHKTKLHKKGSQNYEDIVLRRKEKQEARISNMNQDGRTRAAVFNQTTKFGLSHQVANVVGDEGGKGAGQE